MKNKELSTQDVELIVELIKKQEKKYARLVDEEERIANLGFGHDVWKLYKLKERLAKIQNILQKVVSNPMDDLSIQDIETIYNVLTVGQVDYEDYIKFNIGLSENTRAHYKKIIKESKSMAKKVTNYLNERKTIEKNNS